MEKYDELKAVIESIEDDVNKLYEKDVKAAAPRIRKAMQEVKRLAQEIRVDAQDHKASIGSKRKAENEEE